MCSGGPVLCATVGAGEGVVWEGSRGGRGGWVCGDGGGAPRGRSGRDRPAGGDGKRVGCQWGAAEGGPGESPMTQSLEGSQAGHQGLELGPGSCVGRGRSRRGQKGDTFPPQCRGLGTTPSRWASFSSPCSRPTIGCSRLERCSPLLLQVGSVWGGPFPCQDCMTCTRFRTAWLALTLA